MAKHKETGIKGEQIAENFLLNKGYTILHKSWRWQRKEIDIIARYEGFLIFVEVKTRYSFDFGFPEEAVSPLKQQHMKIAAEAFAEDYTDFESIRFDIISILMKQGAAQEILHFEDAFY